MCSLARLVYKPNTRQSVSHVTDVVVTGVRILEEMYGKTDCSELKQQTLCSVCLFRCSYLLPVTCYVYFHTVMNVILNVECYTVA